MTEKMVPIFRVSDARATAGWYARLGFEIVGEHRFTDKHPLFLFLQRGETNLYLSEHKGDAPKRSLAYFWVDDIDEIAAEFGEAIRAEPWGREITLVDPDGNRIRAATAQAPEA